MTPELATVEYQIGTYRGTVTVVARPDHDDEQVIRSAKRQLKARVGVRPFGCETWRVLRREAADG